MRVSPKVQSAVLEPIVEVQEDAAQDELPAGIVLALSTIPLPSGRKAGAILQEFPKRNDFILKTYQNLDLRDDVVAFFSLITHSNELAAVMLANANEFDIPPSMAFALCWEESRYNPFAINNKNRNASIDRGLFQLNNASFPNLSEDDFYNPSINAYYGMAHLRWCLDLGGSEIAALAMYNAGTTRVRSGGTPKDTLDYISRILGNQRKIEELFSLVFGSENLLRTEDENEQNLSENDPESELLARQTATLVKADGR
ncbi:MAG: lytic transglycosylase domain-containing protein [Treponema sp.]|nr:lytic transglycosylase domain-containing protein [Treponema sp.]